MEVGEEPFQFFVPYSTNNNEGVEREGAETVFTECAVEKRVMKVMKTVVEAQIFSNNELGLKWGGYGESSKGGYAQTTTEEDRVMRVLPEAILQYLSKNESNF